MCKDHSRSYKEMETRDQIMDRKAHFLRMQSPQLICKINAIPITNLAGIFPSSKS